jgi:hypothetical protein
MSGNRIDFSYALWNSPVEQAMLQEGDTSYTVAHHSDEHCTLTVREGRGTPMSVTLSLAECEDELGERGLLRSASWQSIYPASWPTGFLEKQKTGNKLETAFQGGTC